MNRRDFVKFLGVSSASIPIASALAKMPEVEPKIILLDKPKDIILNSSLPDVDFIINHIISIGFSRNDNVNEMHTIGRNSNVDNDFKNYYFGAVDINLELEFYTDHISGFSFIGTDKIKPATFTFDLDFNNENAKYTELEKLNGRKFIAIEYSINARKDSFTTISLSGKELNYNGT